VILLSEIWKRWLEISVHFLIHLPLGGNSYLFILEEAINLEDSIKKLRRDPFEKKSYSANAPINAPINAGCSYRSCISSPAFL
jgi:hypothetical protein